MVALPGPAFPRLGVSHRVFFAIGCVIVISVWNLMEISQKSPGFNPVVPMGCEAGACDGHDPSGLQRVTDSSGHVYYLTFVTGSGQGEALGVRFMQKGDPTWRKAKDSYLYPSWIPRYFPVQKMGCAPGQNKACPLWAPDLPSNGNAIRLNNDMVVFFSVSDFIHGDKSTFCIGVATGSWPKLELKDSGSPVICSNRSQSDRYGAPHALDPSGLKTSQGLTRGGGIWAVSIDPETWHLSHQARKACGDDYPFCFNPLPPTAMPSPGTWVNIANHRGYHAPDGSYIDGNAIEASYLFNYYQQNGYYYLFVNWYWCCRGKNSTYQIRVGRSDSPLGHFVDDTGVDMQESGGYLVLNASATSEHQFVGPGHSGILHDKEDDKLYFTTSYEAIDNKEMQLYAFEMEIDENGWPRMLSQVFTGLPDSHGSSTLKDMYHWISGSG
ncbi:hypothetical protein AAMO2058_000151000 [Amorphochlora amoebiformis]